VKDPLPLIGRARHQLHLRLETKRQIVFVAVTEPKSTAGVPRIRRPYRNTLVNSCPSVLLMYVHPTHGLRMALIPFCSPSFILHPPQIGTDHTHAARHRFWTGCTGAALIPPKPLVTALFVAIHQGRLYHGPVPLAGNTRPERGQASSI
jgi:hypothetical protein